MSATIVVVEDEGIIAVSLQDMLEEFGYRVPAIAATAAEALDAIAEHEPDLLLLDIHLAGGDDGIALAAAVRKVYDLPVVFLTAHSDAPTVARARATEPAHFLLKPFNEREVQIAIDMALTRYENERRLRASERRFATTLRSIADGVIVTDAASQITYLNPAATLITGWPAPDALGRALDEVFQAELGGQPLSAVAAQAMLRGEPVTLAGDATLTRRDGALRQIADSIAPLIDERRQVGGAVLVLHDVTEERRAAEEHRQMERKLLEAQRLESLGVLAGGIAHDFNNLLTFILGYVELARAELPATAPASYYLMEALNGGQQAANLIKQMLAYTGKGRFQVERLELNALLGELHTLIRASLGRRVHVELQLDPAVPTVEADPTQLHQVVLNLLTNAAEAMEGREGGITVATGVVSLGAEELRRCLLGDELPPGPYAYVRVRDAGVGMDEATLARIFDPFFTTKFTGRGLGLAAVQGILRAHQGALQVVSAPDSGSVFTVYLPVTTSGAETVATDIRGRAPEPEAALIGPQPHGTLLVIDDEPGVRQMTARMLERIGYRVLAVPGGPEGLALLKAGVPDLQGIILDLTMPGISGEIITQQIQELRPGTPIILMSTYSAEEVARHYQGSGLRCFLQKPFTRDALVAALRSILATGGAEAMTA